jgi:hypothetical protein
MSKHFFQAWVHGQGRFFPFAWYGYYVFFLFDVLILYKISIVLFILSSVGMFGLLVRKLTGSAPWALFAMLVAPACFQLRFGNDPILSYHLLRSTPNGGILTVSFHG